jgi:hypothetical protein
MSIPNEPYIEDRHFRTIVAELEALKKLYRIACADLAKSKAQSDQLTRWFDGIAAASKAQAILPLIKRREILQSEAAAAATR